MRILHVCETYFPIRGGAEVHINEICKQSSKNGIRTQILTSSVIQSESMHDNFVTRWNISERGIKSLIKFPALILRLCFKFKDIDLLHAHYSSCLAAASAIACKLTNKPILITLHGRGTLPSSINGSFSAKIWRYISFKLCKNFIAPSAEIERIAKMLAPKARVIEIPNGVDVSKFERQKNRNFDNKNIDFVVFRRLTPKNGTFFAVLALFELSKRNSHKEFTLNIIGDGPERTKIKELIETNQLPNLKIYLHGSLDHLDAIPILNSCDFSIFFSSAEAISLALLETMSLGIVPICTPIGGFPEIIEQKLNGFLAEGPISGNESTYLVPSKISPNKLSMLSNVLCEASELTQDEYFLISNNCVKTAKKYDWTIIFNALSDEYKSLVKTKSLFD